MSQIERIIVLSLIHLKTRDWEQGIAMAQTKESSVVEKMAELTIGKNKKETGEMIAQLPIANINQKLPPELLTAIFQFLPFDELKNALLVCR